MAIVEEYGVSADQRPPGSVTIVVSGISEARGSIELQLLPVEHQTRARWSVEELKARFPVDGSAEILVFHDVPPGEYIAWGYHDMNDNGQRDTDPLGGTLEDVLFPDDTEQALQPHSDYEIDHVSQSVIHLIMQVRDVEFERRYDDAAPATAYPR